MKTTDQSLNSIHDLLLFNTKKIADAETQLVNVLPDWASKAKEQKLKDIINKYRDSMTRQIEKMNSFFAQENISPANNNNEIMNALIFETDGKISACKNEEVKDACILASIQEINHYKISVYGTLTAFANLLKTDNSTTLFHEAEITEKQIDDRLSQLAEHEINGRAKAPVEAK